MNANADLLRNREMALFIAVEELAMALFCLPLDVPPKLKKPACFRDWYCHLAGFPIGKELIKCLNLHFFWIQLLFLRTF